MQERPRPQVTVTDPARPSLRLTAGPPPDDAPPAGPQRGRWRALLGALGLLAAAVLIGQDLLEQRRHDRAVSLRLAGPLAPTAIWSYDRPMRTATLVQYLTLRNDGPRPVRVVSARLGELRFTGEVALDARTGSAVVAVKRRVRCPADGSRPPPEPDRTETVDVAVVTPAGRTRVAVPTGLPPGGGAQFGSSSACGYGALEDTVGVLATVTGGGDAAGRVPVRVAVISTSQRRVQLVSLAFARGLDVLALDDGATTLPVPLGRPQPGARSVLTLDVRLSIGCGALVATGGVRLGDLDVLVEDVDEQDRAQVSGRVTDPAPLRHAVRRTCSSG